MELLFHNRYLVMRRFSQITLLVLFVCGNLYGWRVLRGSLSGSRVLDSVTLSDPFALLQVAATGNLVARDVLIGGLIVLVFFGLIAGRAFCSWVCPMNMVTDLAEQFRTRLPGKAAAGLSISGSVRYWAAGLALVLSALLGIAAFEWISPISALQRGLIFGMGAGWTAVAAVFFFDLFVVKHGFCGHVCPLGAFYSLISRFSLLRVRHSEERCTRCMKCIEHCPEQQVLAMVGVRTQYVTSGECTNCGKCIDVCEDNAMGAGLRWKS